jgi:putative copper export protein
MASESLFEWQDVVFEYVGFLASFAMLGAVGFRYGVLRFPAARLADAGDSALRDAFERAAEGAAAVGLVGAGLGIVSFFVNLHDRAEGKHQTLSEAFAKTGAVGWAQAALLLVLVASFSLARRRSSAGWPLAGVAAIAFALRSALTGRLAGMVNPLHVLGGSLWLGTLFVLVFCGIAAALRPTVPVAERERAVAEMVRRFSSLALFAVSLLAVSGLITGWTHLKSLAALWTTPYGYVLISKLCVVAVVAALGAWNWRKVGPSLGSDGGARRIRRTAATELGFAAVVLAITAVLVSVPSPKRPPAVTPVHVGVAATHGG